MFCRPQDAHSTTESSTARSALRHSDSRTRTAGSCSPAVKERRNSSCSVPAAADQVASTVACSIGSGALESSAGSNTNSGLLPYSRRSAASSRQWMPSSRLPFSG